VATEVAADTRTVDEGERGGSGAGRRTATARPYSARNTRSVSDAGTYGTRGVISRFRPAAA
jgi:hypothetical protein